MRVPIYDEQHVEPRPISTQYSNLKAYDAGPGIAQVADRFGNIAEGAANVLAGVKKEADDAKTADSLAQFQAYSNTELHGNHNPSTGDRVDAAFDDRDITKGFFDAQGEEALAEGQKVLERLDNKRRELSDGLSNEEQRRLFEHHSGQLLNDSHRQIEAHISREGLRAKEDSHKALMQSALEAVALNPGDDETAATQSATVIRSLDGLTTSVQDQFAKADMVKSKIAQVRLDSLLSSPTGWPEADKVLKANRSVLGARVDEYEKRINDAKQGSVVQVMAEKIVVAAGNANISVPFGEPDQATAEQLIAKAPIELQAKLAPAVNARIAMQKEAAAVQKKAFINKAIGIYNQNHATFFTSDIAKRLNEVDAETYKGLVKDARTEARLAGDDSAQARREQKDNNDIAMDKYKTYGDGDPSARAELDLNKFLRGRGVNDKGRADIEALQAKDKNTVSKGLAVPQTAFIEKFKAEIKSFAPPAGHTATSRAAAAQWWRERQAEAIDAYTNWTDNNPGKKPTAADLAKMKHELIVALPVTDNPESRRRSADALRGMAQDIAGDAQIPPEERAKIEAALRKRNRPVTEEAVQALYHQVHGG